MATASRAAVVGAGLAGAEAALVLASRGISVDLFEMRPAVMTPAHTTGDPAELVCSNSFKSLAPHTAHGVLKRELELLSSPLIAAARESAVPAGSALAVDRALFSAAVLKRLVSFPSINLVRREVASPPPGYAATIIAAGPLASEPLTAWLAREHSAAALHFYDAIAPIVSLDSIDLTVAFFASRDNRGGPEDYLNCPFSEERYRAFHAALCEADLTVAHAFEDARFFEACLPVEVIASRGEMALAFGPLKPVGLVDPHTGRRPFAAGQLRRENAAGSCFNMVGFQTRLRQGEQQRVFRMVPGLENAEFLRFGSIHRNTYLEAPRLLSGDLSFRQSPSLFLAGQLCGSEGYTESMATGHLAALFALARIRGTTLEPPPPESALGALLRHVTTPGRHDFTPTNVHFGLFPPLPDTGKRIKKKVARDFMGERAVTAVEQWCKAVRE
ncbi:MAG: methylenetetrahydrofolate--tRNA-(uracil(54)-C(5))-methyltransferase (FADH(2)-oxidizing) TrmFO [Chitinispirillaceae bacterium]|nr:methylenetetrahydrofolate--tRNA-(uracil(54)-C(5))-methyltransferase (FADH(2)-oxidizing) TrmFO [Chitinispirillaceae bacterium]